MNEETKENENLPLNGAGTGNVKKVVTLNEAGTVNEAGAGTVNEVVTGNVPVNGSQVVTTQTNESNPEANESEDEIILKDVQAIRTAITDYKTSRKEDKKKKAAEIISKVKTLSIRIKGGAKTKKNKGSESIGNLSGNVSQTNKVVQNKGSESIGNLSENESQGLNQSDSTSSSSTTGDSNDSLLDLRVFDEFTQEKIISIKVDFNSKITELKTKLISEAEKCKYNGDIDNIIEKLKNSLENRIKFFENIKTEELFKNGKYSDYRERYVSKQIEGMKSIYSEIKEITKKYINIVLLNEKIKRLIKSTHQKIEDNKNEFDTFFNAKDKPYEKKIQEKEVQINGLYKEIEELQKKIDVKKKEISNIPKNEEDKQKKIEEYEKQLKALKKIYFSFATRSIDRDKRKLNLEQKIKNLKNPDYKTSLEGERTTIEREKTTKEENIKIIKGQIIEIKKDKQSCKYCITEIDKVVNELFFKLSSSILSFKVLFGITNMLLIKEFDLAKSTRYEDSVTKFIKSEYGQYQNIFKELNEPIKNEYINKLNEKIKSYKDVLVLKIKKEKKINQTTLDFDIKMKDDVYNADYYNFFYDTEKSCIIDIYGKMSEWNNFNNNTINKIKVSLLISLIKKYTNDIFLNIQKYFIKNTFTDSKSTKFPIRINSRYNTAGLIYEKKQFNHYYKKYVYPSEPAPTSESAPTSEKDELEEIFNNTNKLFEDDFKKAIKDDVIEIDALGTGVYAGLALNGFMGGYTNKKKFIRNRITYKKR